MKRPSPRLSKVIGEQSTYFALRQAVELYDFYRGMVASCDRELEAKLGTFSDSNDELSPLGKKPRTRASLPLGFDGRGELHRISGVDLTQVPGIDELSALKIVSEIGLDMTRWRHIKAFASWLGLCPGSKVSGGKLLSSRSKACANRAAAAFRMAAYSVQHSKTYLGAYYRRMKARMGPAKAITATAHKLARIVYSMLRNQTPYVHRGFDSFEEEYRKRRIASLMRSARSLGFQLLPKQENPPATADGTAVSGA